MARYRKVVQSIEAIQWDGTNADEVIAIREGDPALNWVTEYLADGTQILTLQGTLTMNVTDWLVGDGTWIVMDNAAFSATYTALP